jgi:hypothetical protein
MAIFQEGVWVVHNTRPEDIFSSTTKSKESVVMLQLRRANKTYGVDGVGNWAKVLRCDSAEVKIQKWLVPVLVKIVQAVNAVTSISEAAQGTSLDDLRRMS